MKGLILKDLFLIKGNIRSLIICLFIFIISIFNDASSIPFFLQMISIIMCLTTFSYDEYNKWDAYAITLMKNRKKIVKSKYVFTIMIMIITSLLSLLINVIICNSNGSVNLEEIVSNTLGYLFGVIIFISIMYPIIYKFGIEKSRIFILVICFGLSIGLTLIFKNINIDLDKFLSLLEQYWLILIPIISCIAIYISYIFSYKFYLKKDL